MPATPNFLEELNPMQREAVLYTDGPSLIIAGAGAGKTRVLTYKIAYILDQGVAPWNILALTFTNKAAKEMRERIGVLIGTKSAARLWMGTFHSIFARILRCEARYLNLNPNYTIYDQSDSRSLLKNIIKDMGLDEKIYKPATVGNRISAAKNRLILPANYLADEQMRKYDAMNNLQSLSKIYEEYAVRCKRANALDFDDLLLYTYILFSTRKEVCERYAENFRYVLVDEYQDTNYAQHAIIWLLTNKRQNLCVVGDDAQSIYSFRGAEIDNILQFTQRYDNARLFKLEQNYRSTQSIVEAANDIISNNRGQIKKHIFSENEPGDPVYVFQAYSDLEEAEIACNKIRELKRNKGLGYNQFAILYRTNSQSRVFEETMRKRLIPYRVYGGLSFYQRKEIKDVLAYFRLAINPYDEEALRRVINYPTRGIGDTTLKKITSAASAHNASPWDVLSDPSKFNAGISGATSKKLSTFRTLIESFHTQIENEDAYTLGIRIIRESGILHDISQDLSPESQSRKENIEELANAINTLVEERKEETDVDFVSLVDYMSQVSLLSDMDTDESDDDKVTLMTIHASKGLEFKAVFLVGVEENIFPNANAVMSQRQLEEERRLFYVAITRAREYCFLSYSKSRFRYGKMEFCSPSPFLQEALRSSRVCQAGQEDALLPRTPLRRKETVTSENMLPPKPAFTRFTDIAPKTETPHTGSAEITAITAGCRIEHERFGLGKVTAIEGSGDNRKATVEFINAGRKQLLLKFARFKIVE